MSSEKSGAWPGATESAPGETAPCTKSRVRDRIFETACDLFYRHGIHGVGVDAIAAEAGSNKMSFYRSFASKDALVVAYLREQEREYWVWWDTVVGRHPGEPRRQVEALFEAQFEIAMSNECRGCALGNAAAELSDDEDELSTLVRAYKERVRRRLQAMAQAMGARDADTLGDALMLLLDGGYFTRLVFPLGSGPICAALPAVRALIDAHLPQDRRPTE
ncbi:MAG: TetR/AcrR family transcriptional regulator [Steroidobacteraceae bacterium]